MIHKTDQTVSEVGEKSGFKYRTAFNTYMKYFLKALSAGGSKARAININDLFAWYNGIVFPQSWLPPKTGKAESLDDSSDGDVEDEINKALDRLDVSNAEGELEDQENSLERIGESMYEVSITHATFCCD